MTDADPRAFALNPLDYGLPDRRQLAALRIWDTHYHGLMHNVDNHERMKFYVERLGIERAFSLDIGGTLQTPLEPHPFDDEQRRILEAERDWLCGMVSVDPGDPEGSIEKMDKWIGDGPCVGIKYAGGNPQGVPCSHPNNDPILRRVGELEAMVYIHTWIKVGGEPRRVGDGNNAGESTPMDVAELARRFPDQPLICGHAGGDWELGVRAVRDAPNVFLEFSGHDSHSGQVDYAVRHLGADRVVWGGHGPSRSFATELSKIFDADLTWDERKQVLGGNLRRIAEASFRRRDLPITL